MNANLIAFNLATAITNAAHIMVNTAGSVVPSVTSSLVRSGDALSGIATSFAAGIRYANVVNRQTGEAAAFLTEQDGETFRGIVEQIKR